MNSTRPITVLICDDSALIRNLFSEVLNHAEGITVVDTATDAQDAREKIKRLNPDVLTLDIEMPGMDGLSFLEKIMALRPMPVVMASTLTQKGATASLRALEIGAVDTVGKPQNITSPAGIAQLREELVSKVRAAAGANLRARHSGASQVVSAALTFQASSATRRMIAIGSSTGGVEALREVFLKLPANCPPIVVTQHMPEHFTATFAARLNAISAVEVAEAEDGAPLKTGHAWLAPGGNRHLRVVNKNGAWFCALAEGPEISSHRPSVDVLFASVAEAAGARAVGAILTGMGHDGAAGLLAMRQHGAFTIGQSEASCIVYGMPKAAMLAGAVQAEIPLSDIPARLLSECARPARSQAS